MTSPSPSSSDADPLAQAAASWVLRLDRGLTAEEQDAYSQWLAADSRHREAIALHRWGWDELDRLAGIQTTVHALPDPDLLRPRRPVSRLLRFWPQLSAGIAAALMLAPLGWWADSGSGSATELRTEPSYALAAPIQERVLDDGSTVILNRGAVIETAFTAGLRQVRLLRGEANFIVAKDAQRAFIVSAGEVDVRAVGTVFNVRLGNNDVEVLVSHGQVGVSSRSGLNEADARAAEASTAPPRDSVRAGEVLLGANQRVVLPLAPPRMPTTVAVATVEEGELERKLAWQPRMLDFTDAPMSSIVSEFNRRNAVRLVLADPTLDQIRLSATFRSDNVEGFLRLMESDFGLRATWRSEAEVVLSRR